MTQRRVTVLVLPPKQVNHVNFKDLFYFYGVCAPYVWGGYSAVMG